MLKLKLSQNSNWTKPKQSKKSYYYKSKIWKKSNSEETPNVIKHKP